MNGSQQTAVDVKQTTLEAMEAQDEKFVFQESDLGIMPGTASQHSKAQPNNDIVLRIECITDRQMKVWCCDPVHNLKTNSWFASGKHER